MSAQRLHRAPRLNTLAPFIYTAVMHHRSVNQRLQDTVSRREAAIVYDPRDDEIDLADPSFPLRLPLNRIILPFDKNSDPFAWSLKCAVEFAGLDACLFIPGKRFDLAGTRHGRGGGWYDRFLSKIPSSWLRIGVAPMFDISPTPLKREAWDEPVDWVLAVDGHNWTVFETKARNSHG